MGWWAVASDGSALNGQASTGSLCSHRAPLPERRQYEPELVQPNGQLPVSVRAVSFEVSPVNADFALVPATHP
jgi:hypothetical protein